MREAQPARYVRSKDDRNLKARETDCCKSLVARYKPLGAATCEVCGTHLAITGKGHLFTEFGKNYFEIRAEIARKKKEDLFNGILVEMPNVRVEQCVE